MVGALDVPLSFLKPLRFSQLSQAGCCIFLLAARSPVFSHTTNSFQGLSIIRAYRKQAQFIRDFNRYQDQHSEAWFAYLAANRWFGLRLDIIVVIFTAGIVFVSVPLKGSK